MDAVLIDQAGDDASLRFAQARSEIKRVQQGIAQTREGTGQITDIATDAKRIRQRIAREGQLDHGKAMERINNVANFQDVCIVKKILRLSDSVCRITIPTITGGSGYGTGFLIAPGIIITNHHVFESPEAAKYATIKFRYELDEQSRPSRDVTFSLRPDKFFMTSGLHKKRGVPFSGLDFTLVAVEALSLDGPAITEFPHIVLDGSTGKILEGESCVVIQHPQGDYKKIVLKDIRMLTLTDDFLVYESDTLPGSSGSMVVALGTGEVVAVHHSGVPRKNANGDWLRKDGGIVRSFDPDHVIDWLGNEGIRISSILKAIAGMEVLKKMESSRKKIVGIHANPKPVIKKSTAAKTATPVKKR